MEDIFSGNFNDSSFLKYSCADGIGISHNSVTTEYWDSSNGDTRIAALATAILTICFFLVGLPSNFLIIVSILRKKLYVEPTYILIMNLAAADFLLCVLVMPFAIVSGFAGNFIFGKNDNARCIVCQLGLFFTALAQITIQVLALLSVDRLIFVKWPLKYYKIVTTKRVCIIMVIVWTWSTIISTFPLFGFGDIAYSPSISSCVIKFTEETKLTKNIYYAIFQIIVGIVSLSALFISNVWVACIVQKHLRKIYSIRKNISSSEKNFVNGMKEKLSKTKYQKQLQFVKVFGATFVANLITWIPIIVRVFYSVIRQRNTSSLLMVSVYVSMISVAIIHPLIQASILPGLRKYFTNFRNLFFCCCKRWKLKRKGSRCWKCNCWFMFTLTFLPIDEEFNVDTSLQSV